MMTRLRPFVAGTVYLRHDRAGCVECEQKGCLNLPAVQQGPKADLGTRSKNRKDYQKVRIAPRPWNRGLHFIFLWGKSEDVLQY